MMRTASAVLIVAFVLVIHENASWSHPAHAQAAGAPRTAAGIWDGVYTTSQAARGKQAFDTVCVRCHAGDLSGNTGPALKGETFIGNWETDTLSTLFRKIRDTMPPNFGARIPEDAKLDIVAYLLQSNGFPAGIAELPLDDATLERIRIVRSGSADVLPNFSLVQVVGCLVRGETAWLLTKAAEPAPANAPPADDAATLGNQVFELVSAHRFKPEEHGGRKVEARGLLYRDPREGNILNLTALRQLASACPE